MSTNSKDEHQPPSSQQKNNTTPLSEILDISELLPRRRKHQSTKKNRRNPSRLTKEEIKYQHFVRDLKRDIQICMKQSMREIHFDSRDAQSTKTDPSIRLLRTALKSRQKPSTIVSHQTDDNETIINTLANRQDPLSFLKHNETKRLTANVQTILAEPTMKDFYTQFIHCLPK